MGLLLFHFFLILRYFFFCSSDLRQFWDLKLRLEAKVGLPGES